MTTKARELNSSDIIFANLVKQGRELISISITGVTSISEIISYLRHRLGTTLGHAVVKIRNYTQGWSLQQGVYFRPATLAPGTQLTLF